MTQKQIEILKSIEQEFNRINEQEVVDTNDLIAQIENRVDSKRKLRLELDVVDKANRRLFDTFKKKIVDKLMPITKKYGFKFEENVTNEYVGLKITCNGYKNNYDNYNIILTGYLRYQYKYQDCIKYVHSPIPIYEKSYMSNDVTEMLEDIDDSVGVSRIDVDTIVDDIFICIDDALSNMRSRDCLDTSNAEFTIRNGNEIEVDDLDINFDTISAIITDKCAIKITTLLDNKLKIKS